jgi:transcriptional regulator with XRE-family HTH domain
LSAARDRDVVEALVGERLRRLRGDRDLTLESVAAATGFTKSYLSKIENGRKVPPIASLARIARALQIDVGAFFRSTVDEPASQERISVVRAGDRRQVIRGGSAFGYDYESLAHDLRGKHLEPFIFTFPQSLSRDVSFEHEGEEVIFVLSGRVELEVGGSKHTLGPGDAVLFDSSLPHRGRSIRGDAKALVVIYNPASEQSEPVDRVSNGPSRGAGGGRRRKARSESSER